MALLRQCSQMDAPKLVTPQDAYESRTGTGAYWWIPLTKTNDSAAIFHGETRTEDSKYTAHHF